MTRLEKYLVEEYGEEGAKSVSEEKKVSIMRYNCPDFMLDFRDIPCLDSCEECWNAGMRRRNR